MLWLALAYGALVVYGTLFPLDEWRSPVAGWINPITAAWPHTLPRADLLVNLLAYVPLGLFMALALRVRLGTSAALLIAAVTGCLLSFTLETLQSALPSRVTSPVDWLANTAGTLGGALFAAALDPRLAPGRALSQWRRAWFAEGTLASLALIILGMWVLTQAAPFVPSLDWGNLKAGLRPLGNTLRHPATFEPVKACTIGLQIFALGLLVRCVAQRAVVWPFIAFSLAVLLLKIPVVGRQLSLEALAGWLGASVVLLAFPLRGMATRALPAMLALLTAHALAQFVPGQDAATVRMNWIPFRGQVGTLDGMLDILETLWPFMAMGLFARWLTAWRWRAAVMLGGALSVAAFAFLLEWMQQSIPGRFADVTDVLLALLGWFMPWLFAETHAARPRSAADHPARGLRWALPGVVALMVSLGVAAWHAGSEVRVATDDRGRTMLPAPEDLTAISLPGFRHEHPRLPHPSAQDIKRLQRENPAWVALTRKLADGGQGDIQASIVMAYIEPGSQDLARLHAQLIAMHFSFRGHQQAKPIAQAYDWLYAQWSPTQREALRGKLAEAVGYLVNLIRKDRLSPYNVYLYNSPFQALVAANLALYGDDPRGELYMRFTYDLWKHRVLPVWRQIMGKNGGWHEGGEYVGIGIGQAIYQVPAMWRSATGEDVLQSEPGLRGFLDFAVYRKRPDGTDFRWGDAGFFNNIIPDLVPLALEQRHAAAYNLRPPQSRPLPSSWPWGPLTDSSLLQADARASLPLTRHFDGIGLVVARSDWSPDATYLTFKAGDNYWSHSHLDQGAFTLYKGGGLALDSGFYGPKYGSDHHLNYTYQSIAHNLVTVTDPADTAPTSGKTARAIANDGGQRRIGSGWGVESAPIDLNEWLGKRELYHTGVMRQVHDGDDSVVMIADLTPAYTNSGSGPGEFSHRTRRVERMWRTLVYDRRADVVIVHDLVEATRPEFRKRWLLHTQNAPQIAGTRFTVQVPPDPGRQARGGQLQGVVVLPAQPDIRAVGGPGFEFWVDGRNYDENGTLAAAMARKGQPAEAGAWRIELSPAAPAREDEFLVVLVPRLAGESTLPDIRGIADGAASGVQVRSNGVTRTWWFERGTQRVRLESEGRRVVIGAEPGPAPAAPGVWERLRAWWQTR